MPTIVVIVTFISMINTTFESLKERKGFILQHFSFMSNEFVLIVVVHGKSFITLVPDFALSCKLRDRLATLKAIQLNML